MDQYPEIIQEEEERDTQDGQEETERAVDRSIVPTIGEGSHAKEHFTEKSSEYSLQLWGPVQTSEWFEVMELCPYRILQRVSSLCNACCWHYLLLVHPDVGYKDARNINYK
ncbi:hypothetical protein RND71_035385 [Anisodus tanguticus]|uniref:Uncharacterized protein n=1 Tax=Anisodus tanguticus TaxID=243964 RepID=A0AAE1R469_9SOLA|nr:hypothetical protein RND71_035385 [Anisodus tanguticus]